MFIYIQNFNEMPLICYMLNAKFICIYADHTGIKENLGNMCRCRFKSSYLENFSKNAFLS